MSEQQTEAIREHLTRVLGSPLFDRSQRQSAFLRFVVEKTLDGRRDDIKEYEIAVQVYERRVDHSTRTDPIVRVEASRLRAKLLEYYSSEGRGEAIRIELPKGTYVPEFTSAVAPPPPPVPEPAPKSAPRTLSRGWLLTILPIAAIVAWVGFRPTGSQFRAPDSRIPQSFAVLAIRNTTGTDGELVESLTESLIAEMLHVSWPNWRSRPPVLRATPGKRPEAEALFSGSLYRTGNRIRVSGSLEHLASGVILWNGSLERNLEEWTDRSTLLENVAAALAEAMNVALMERMEQEFAAVYPPRVKSRHDWLAADELWRRPDADSVRAALPLLENACRLDPNFAWAHASLAHAYVKAVGLGIVPDEPYRKRARQEVAKALELGPYLAFAHASAARVALNLDWDFQGANASCIASIGMLAAAGTVRNQCAIVQSLAERYDLADAISNSTLRRLPDNVSALTELAITHYRRRRFDQAIAYAERALRNRPQAVPAREVLALAHLQRKAFDRVRQVAQEGESIAGEAGRFAAIHAAALAAGGNRETAMKETARAEALFVDPMPKVPLIRTYLALGNSDRARKLLEEALRRRDVGLLEMRLDPMIKDLDSQGMFEQVRSKARF